MVMAEASVAYDCLTSLGEMLEQEYETRLLFDQKVKAGLDYIDNGGRPDDDAKAYDWGQFNSGICSDKVTCFFYSLRLSVIFFLYYFSCCLY